MVIKLSLNKGSLKWLVFLLIAAGLFFGGYFFRQSADSSQPAQQTIDQKTNYYISFDDYYYEVPKPKTADDRLIAGGQFLYNIGQALKTNTLDDLFNGGAIAVQNPSSHRLRKRLMEQPRSVSVTVRVTMFE